MRPIAELVGNEEEFPVLRNWVFLNHAGVCPLPRVAAEALRTYAQQAEAAGYLGAAWYLELEKLRQETAALINAHRDEIAFVKNTSEGLSIVARGIDWQWGDRIVTTNVEYPANVYPWMDLVHTRAVKLVMAEEVEDNGVRRVPTEKIIEAASHPRTRMVSLSHVQFASGQRMDVEAIGKFCRERAILFCVDAIQTMGILPVDVKGMNIDYLAADGHKWLLGPEGAGVFYCRKELQEHTRPLMVGWLNVVNAMEYGSYDYTLKPDAGRFECGTYNVAGLLALRASMGLIRSVGVEAVRARIKHLTDDLAAGLAGRGFRVVSPRGEGEWSGSVCFVLPGQDHSRIVSDLRKQYRMEIALREGRLRASPHFYNTEQQIDALIAALPQHVE
ncbi:MAG TPA: aminotransferase class V-fold PLP-dependent enzyme [Tepidisphaeraceae bacterium]|jgi:selenocysteine lyase/cysteine desulfurase|nr:aminotransferase class V-fold PLP-dependent enzyme [Tepidisphaeraceae bacterium]